MKKHIISTITTIIFALCFVCQIQAAESVSPKSYESPNKVAEAFLKALEANDTKAIRSMLGPKLRTRIESNPGLFDQALKQWLDRRGQGLAITSKGPINNTGPDDWSCGVTVTYKKEGTEGTMMTQIPTISHDKEQKTWWLNL